MSSKPLRYLLCALIVCLGWWGYEQAIDHCHSSNFYLSKWPNFNSTTRPETVDAILNQPFTYLGKGRQFYVYASEDGKWVLKFIKCQRINVSPLYEKLPLPAFLDNSRTKRLAAKRERIERLFSSLQLAQNRISDLTGVLYVHLKQSEEKLNVALKDRFGFATTLDINKVPFVVQKRAKKVFSELDRLYVADDRTQLQKRLLELVDLFKALAARNVIDIDDGAFMRDNIGFLSDRAIYVDVGTFIATDQAQERFKQDSKRFKPVIDWLLAKDQTLAEPFVRALE